MNADDSLIQAQFSADAEEALAVRRFFTFVPRRGVGCWLWVGKPRGNGYGGFKAGYQMPAHRFAFIHSGGVIEGKAEVHHACLNGMCVRPSHLEALTRPEHIKRSRLAKLAASTVSS